MKEKGQRGGIQIGNIGGDVNFEAGGDIIGGNKTTTTSNGGFRGNEERDTFQRELEHLQILLREIKTHIQNSPDIDNDDKDNLETDILAHAKDLKAIQDETASLGVGPAPEAVTHGIESRLEKAGNFLDRLHGIASKGTDLALKVGGLIAKAVPMVAKLRDLFDLG